MQPFSISFKLYNLNSTIVFKIESDKKFLNNFSRVKFKKHKDIIKL